MTGKYETVEGLIRYAASEFAACGIDYPSARMAKTIRRTARSLGATTARVAVDQYLDRSIAAATWAGFELFAAGGYRDPTGARAAHNVDHERRLARQK